MESTYRNFHRQLIFSHIFKIRAAGEAFSELFAQRSSLLEQCCMPWVEEFSVRLRLVDVNDHSTGLSFPSHSALRESWHT